MHIHFFFEHSGPQGQNSMSKRANRPTFVFLCVQGMIKTADIGENIVAELRKTETYKSIDGDMVLN